ncbi:hypothetical protein [Sulfitobacter donghicola]|uniref:Uncharacterized protein n=1 Tax=Sulfitobacter donghicola DSW-25 = KCTC 12864 = JCM 14565 TaxID=1300350 RepID=A0A073IE27_9RHOB|nr:hypothetical protein [Sulfitobacter donghicola]KEJ88588.1 hypothetical protein DSW25_15580 [Sulfitobacter donghicola DSW-25 = KCTC 12864 = JCM 14565]KIN69616.1 hypothetical protein Z948_3363 [Sulfitobacter donghicola DSW-25 = KCTC 12864 = JCM 14565]
MTNQINRGRTAFQPPERTAYSHAENLRVVDRCRDEAMQAGLSGHYLCDTNFEPLLDYLQGNRP